MSIAKIDDSTVEIDVSLHGGYKCPRCWHYHYLKDTPDLLCDRCMLVLEEAWPGIPSMPRIKAYLAAQREVYK